MKKLIGFMMLLLLPGMVFGNVFSKVVEVEQNGELVSYELKADIKSANSEFIELEYFRIENDEDILKVIKLRRIGADFWCQQLGFSKVNHMVVGYDEDYFYSSPNEFEGLYIDKDGMYRVGIAPEDEFPDYHPHQILRLSCFY